MDTGRLLSEKRDEIRTVASRHGASNKTSTAKQHAALRGIERLDKRLSEHFDGRILVQPSLTRPLVSFQANKSRPVYRWYKYKEAFSASLVEHLLHKYKISKGIILETVR